jgi:hypothetical protein
VAAIPLFGIDFDKAISSLKPRLSMLSCGPLRKQQLAEHVVIATDWMETKPFVWIKSVFFTRFGDKKKPHNRKASMLLNLEVIP